jgi:Cys-rich protein (TIGR01571 family)
MSSPRKPWSTGLCGCFSDCPGCLDGLCCSPCQQSRQYNVLVNNTYGVNPLVCCTICVVDGSMGGIGTLAMNWHMRQELRKRYWLEGSETGDVLMSCCCGPCSTCQVYRELSAQGAWPQAYCANEAPRISSASPPTGARPDPDRNEEMLLRGLLKPAASASLPAAAAPAGVGADVHGMLHDL